jgi:hypothetical protein
MIIRPVPAYLDIAWTMAIAFALSFLFMLWERSAAQQRPAQLAETAPLVRLALAAESQSMTATAASPSADSGASATAGDDAPILILVRNRRRFDEAEATAKNNSDRPVSLMLVLEDREGEIVARTRLELNPGEARRFGAGDGIDLPRGGKIRATTPGFAREVAIPL